MKITATSLIREMELANDCKFKVTDDQMIWLVALANHPSVQALTQEEVETLVDGEHDEQIIIAHRTPALHLLHAILEDIFNSI